MYLNTYTTKIPTAAVAKLSRKPFSATFNIISKQNVNEMEAGGGYGVRGKMAKK